MTDERVAVVALKVDGEIKARNGKEEIKAKKSDFEQAYKEITNLKNKIGDHPQLFLMVYGSYEKGDYRMIYDNILAEIKSAMKNKETHKKDVLRQVQAKAQATAKDKKCEITDEIVIKAIEKELKQLNQTKESLNSREDTPLFKETILKINILEGWLPKKMTEAEIEEAVRGMLEDGQTMSDLIKKAKAELGSKADGKMIANVVKSG